MSNSEETITKVNEFIAGAFKLIQIGVPVAREAFVIIEIAATLAQRLADNDVITDAEIDSVMLNQKVELNNLLDKD